MTAAIVRFKQKPAEPEVWSCGCGSQEWLLRAEGICVCAECLKASTIVRVLRADHEVALRTLLLKSSCSCGTLIDSLDVKEHGPWCRYRQALIEAGLSQSESE